MSINTRFDEHISHTCLLWSLHHRNLLKTQRKLHFRLKKRRGKRNKTFLTRVKPTTKSTWHGGPSHCTSENNDFYVFNCMVNKQQQQ